MAENRFNPRREQLLQAYTDPNSPTFGNQTRSTLLAYPNMSVASAASHGCRLLKDAQEDGILDQWSQQYRDTTRVRIKTLEAVALGEYENHSVIEHEDAEGTVTHRQRTVSNPNATAVVRANDVLAKLDGTYAQQAIARDQISVDYRTIVDRQRRDLARGRDKKKSTT